MKIFIHSGTHWDREWYQPFQGFRFRLVNMINDLMDGLENTPDYGVFHSDGQTVILEDFLEIEPEQKDRLTSLIQKGKIVIGPWYCMPDEFLVSGESLIRNLRRGMRISASYGVEHCHNAYICDIFGHSAQTPQIFAGLGLHHTVLGRGTNEHDKPQFFRWTAPDGTDVRVFRLEDVQGYGDYTAVGNGPQDDESLKARLKAYFDRRIATSNIPVVFTVNAIDHDHMHRELGNQIRILKELYPDAEIYHVNADEAGKAVDEYIDTLPRYYGELAETAKVPGGYVHVITYTLSSRYPLKKENDTLQTKLEKWVAPAYAFGLTGASRGYLDLAEKYLLRNHPHDSICGCSIDQVHRDMLYRFDQTRLISEEILKTVRGTVSGDLSKWKTGAYAPAAAGDDRVIRIFNPLPYEYEGTVTVVTTFPKSYHKYAEPFGYEGICSFRLYDAMGNEVPYGISDIVLTPGDDTYVLTLRTKLSAGTVTELLVKRSDMPSRQIGTLVTGLRTAENEFVSVRVNDNGSVDLTDKKTGVTYPSLLSVLDDGEIGDGWYHCNPKIDRTVTNTRADIEISEDNPVRVTFKITQHLRLPASYTRGEWQGHDWGIRRSEEYVDQDVVHFVTLAKGERRLTVRTEIDNKTMDHRLRLRFPTGIEGKKYLASQAFCVIERDTDDRPETADWKEYGCIEKNFTGIAAKKNGKGGFAFVSNYGLHECGVSGTGNIDVTLFRSYCKTVGTTGEPDGELLQKMTFEFSLVPFDPDTPVSVLVRTQEIAAAGIEMQTVGGSAANVYRSLFRIEGDDFIYSTAAPFENGIELRFWNCSDGDSTGILTLPEGFTRAELIELDGRKLADLPITDGKVTLNAGKWKLITVKLTK